MYDSIASFFYEIQKKTVTFCGIGGSNLPLLQLFHKNGVSVSARDRRSRAQLGETGEQLESMRIPMILGETYLDGLDEDIIFRTPGMRFHTPELTAARKRGAAVTSEMELFFDLCPCKIYAVTGSDGKTTTTSIIAQFLQAAGKTVHLGGNIGAPLLPRIEQISPDDVAVVELSSFQLISMRKSPNVAVVTNLSPNHLDVHRDMEEYIAAKKNIFLHQNAFSKTVLNADNEITAGFAGETRGDTLFFGQKPNLARGIFLQENGEIVDCPGGQSLLHRDEIKIPGTHNVENYMAAIAAVRGDVPLEAIRQVARTFSGVAHRAELIRVLDGVRYYNDSIATSPTRTIHGTLSLFPQKIILIAGGYDKKIPFDTLGPAVTEKVKLLILMGATAPKIEAAVKNAPAYCQDAPVILHAQDMETAVQLAKTHAQTGDIVSLSPACASFDSYQNFEVRGNHFREIVNAL